MVIEVAEPHGCYWRYTFGIAIILGSRIVLGSGSVWDRGSRDRGSLLTDRGIVLGSRIAGSRIALGSLVWDRGSRDRELGSGIVGSEAHGSGSEFSTVQSSGREKAFFSNPG